MNNIKERIGEIYRRIGEAQAKGGFTDNVELVAVTKYQSVELANLAIAAGVTNIGENHVQALKQRETELLPCNKHFIGHLQTNKVKQLLTVDGLVLIQSVDSLHLAKEISKCAVSANKEVNILIQVNIADEATKFGIDEAEAKSLVRSAAALPNIQIKGLMSILPINAELYYYKRMYDLFADIKSNPIANADMSILSMGMSGDFENAVMCGANMVRIGTYLFS